MTFSFWNDKHDKLHKIEISVNSSWYKLAKTVKSSAFNSLWKLVDNGDNKVQKEELDLFNKFLDKADGIVFGTESNGIIEKEEVEDLLFTEQKNFPQNRSYRPEHTYADTSQTELKNYSYIEEYIDYVEEENSVRKVNKRRTVQVDFSELLPDKKYYIADYEYIENPDGTVTERPYAYEIQPSNNGQTKHWSEGTDRKIKTIKIAACKTDGDKMIKESLVAIGLQAGFNVEEIYTNDYPWVEDIGIVLKDGRIYLPNDEDGLELGYCDEKSEKYEDATQGGVYTNKTVKELEKTLNQKDIVKNKSYLEGGNVLNTCHADGTPASIIGEESIIFTLQSMGYAYSLETDISSIKTEELELAKQEIAKGLNLELENITFIPQYDFHIDMGYRPLQNGVIAIPDYDAGIDILKTKSISGMSDEEQKELIASLSKISKDISEITQKAEQELIKNGYKIIKIPCFYDYTSPDGQEAEPACPTGQKINYMNGITATSDEIGTYYITNESKYPELNELIKDYFQKAGIQNIFFVPTETFLDLSGGIDCLTQEIGVDK